MRKINAIIIVLTIFWIFVSCSKSSEEEGRKFAVVSGDQAAVSWYNFNEGSKLAIEKKKPVVMFFYADWCGWCRKMESEVFADPEVSRKLRADYVSVRINTEKPVSPTVQYKNQTYSHQEFLMMLGVQGLPTVVFMNREGSLITKVPGYIKKQVFLPLLEYIQNECYSKKISFDDFMDGKAACGKKKT